MRTKPILFRGLSEEAQANQLRCRSLPPLRQGESEALVRAFLASRSDTVCPSRYAAPTQRLGRQWGDRLVMTYLE